MTDTIAPAVLKLTRDEAKVLAHYAAGESAREIAASTGVSFDDVSLTLDAVAGNNRNLAHNLAVAWQNRARAVAASRPSSGAPAQRPVSAPPAAAPKVHELQVDGIASMLDAAAATGVAKMVKAAEKIREQITDLQGQLAVHSREARLRDERGQLEARLAQIREQLKGPKRATPSAPVEPVDKVDTKAVRAWAAAEQIPCPQFGRIPGDVMNRYRQAVAA